MKEKIKSIILVVCIVGIVISLVAICTIKLLEMKDNNIQQELLDMVEDNSASVANGETLSKYEELYNENSDFIGWISINDTNIDYPVMHTPNNPEYYLRKDFYGDYSIGGTIFVSGDCTISPRSDNLIIYGHNMDNGSMFADLLNYEKEDYWQNHKTMTFDTLDQDQTYEIVYAFSQDIGVDKDHFEFYNFINGESETQFNDFIKECKENSFYDTNNDPVYGDDLVTLVTCKGYDTTMRMVIVAKAIEN